MTTFHALVWFWTALGSMAIVFVGYIVLLRRLAETIQSKRLEMADIGISILMSDLPENEKRAVSFMLKHAFNGWPASAFVVYLPVHMIRFIWLRITRRKIIYNSFSDGRCSKVANIFMFSTLAANPIAAAIVLFEVLTFGFVCFIIGGHMLLLRAVFAAQRAEASGLLFRSRDRAAA